MSFMKPRGSDPHVESRARDQARWLIRDHGDAAEAVLAAKMTRREASEADLYRYRLTARELRFLREMEPPPERQPSTAVAVWQPRLFSAERLLRLFGIRAIDRRKSPRE